MSDMRATLVALAAAFPELKVKGKKTPYLAVNGNMFAFVDDTGALCLRLSEARKAESLTPAMVWVRCGNTGRSCAVMFACPRRCSAIRMGWKHCLAKLWTMQRG